jgi:hypothetical protein
MDSLSGLTVQHVDTEGNLRFTAESCEIPRILSEHSLPREALLARFMSATSFFHHLVHEAQAFGLNAFAAEHPLAPSAPAALRSRDHPQLDRQSNMPFGEGHRALVPDTPCTASHILAARKAPWPLADQGSLGDPDLDWAVLFHRQHSDSICEWRQARVDLIMRHDAELDKLNQVAWSLMPPLVRCTAKNLKVGFWWYMICILDWPDTGLVGDLIAGFPQVGPIRPTGIFRTADYSASLSIAAFRASSPLWNKRLDALPLPSDNGRQIALQAAWDNTQKEISKGFAWGPFDRATLDRLWGPSNWRAMRRHGVRQGEKYRAIDDARRSSHNVATSASETIHTERADFPARICRRWYGLLSDEERSDPANSLEGAVDDQSHAYRQGPAGQHNYNVVAIQNPLGKGTEFYVIGGLVFGLITSVLHYNRLPELLVAFCRRTMAVWTSHYVDDLPTMEPLSANRSGRHCLERAHAASGMLLDKEKHLPHSKEMLYLGIGSDLRNFADAHVEMHISATRRAKLLSTLDGVLASDRLTGAEASKLRGQLQFALTSVWGRVGRCGLQALSERQYGGAPHDEPLGPHLRPALVFLRACITSMPPRSLPLAPPAEPHTIMYTDAMYEPGKPVRVGGVIFSPRRRRPLGFTAIIPEHVVQSWLPKQQQIGQAEAFAPLVALCAWPELFRDICLLHFVDNTSALACFLKGYSSKQDTAAIVGIMHLWLCHLRCCAWWEHVPSHLNCSDGLSREGTTHNWTAEQPWDLVSEHDVPPVDWSAAQSTLSRRPLATLRRLGIVVSQSA